MKPDRERLIRVMERFGEAKIAVAGDLLADVYVYARPVGLSREAPVMVLAEESQRTTPGGAANAVNNICELAGRALCVGVLGQDAAGDALARYLAGRGADGDRIVRAPGGLTCTKTRVFAGDLHTVKQQVFRLDRYPPSRMTAEVEAATLAAIDRADAEADAWLVSDYDGDFLSPAIIDRLNGIASSKVMVVDSHRRLCAFRGVACATPNEGEAAAAAGVDIRDDASAREAGRRIREAVDAEWIFVTRGNRGMTLVGRSGLEMSLPIVGSSEIVDVAGAGDTVSAVTTLCLALGEEALTAGLLASYAASVVCMKTGVATASPAEVRAAIEKYPLPAV